MAHWRSAVFLNCHDGGRNAAAYWVGALVKTRTRPIDYSILSLTRDLALSQGFSSNLSGGTAADPSRSVLPERAIIQSVDVVRGPFDPSNIEYLEKGVQWDDFKSRL